MARIYTYYLPSVILYTTMFFSISINAGANIEFNFKLPAQTNNLIQIKPKSRTKMSDSIIGIWSGKHINLEVTQNGANIEYDCATGIIDKKIILDEKYRFEVSGTYAGEHGGPVSQNQQPNGYLVKYKGQVKGKKMTLIVKRTDNNKIIGTFTLIFGRESTLVKCR